MWKPKDDGEGCISVYGKHMRKTLVAAFLIAAFTACMTVISCSDDSPTTPPPVLLTAPPPLPESPPEPAPEPEPQDAFQNVRVGKPEGHQVEVLWDYAGGNLIEVGVFTDDVDVEPHPASGMSWTYSAKEAGTYWFSVREIAFPFPEGRIEGDWSAATEKVELDDPPPPLPGVSTGESVDTRDWRCTEKNPVGAYEEYPYSPNPEENCILRTYPHVGVPSRDSVRCVWCPSFQTSSKSGGPSGGLGVMGSLSLLNTDTSCSVPAGATIVSDVPNILVGDGVRCRQIAWTIGNSGGSCMKDCNDEPAPVVVTPPVEDPPVEDPSVVITPPVEDPSVVFTPVVDDPPVVVVTQPVDSCTAAFATYTQSTNEAIQAATCDSLTLCVWSDNACVTCESKYDKGVGVCSTDPPTPELQPEPVTNSVGTESPDGICENYENLYDPPGGRWEGFMWVDNGGDASVCTKKRRGTCEALYWSGQVGGSRVDSCVVDDSWCSLLSRGETGQCKR